MTKILIISDSFLPEENAAAVVMSELQKFYDDLGVETLIATSASGYLDIGRYNLQGVYRISNKWKRSNRFILRAFGELLSAILIGLCLRFQKKVKMVDRVIIYSPSVFWSLTVKIANLNSSKVNYVIRDIFPLWLIKAGILNKKSISYQFLDFFANLQFKTANKIFVQSEQDRTLLAQQYKSSTNKVEVLQTWMNPVSYNHNSEIQEYLCKTKKNILWLGNMGIAQNRDFVISVFKELLENHEHIKIHIVGVKKHDLQIVLKNLGSINNFKDRVNILNRLSHIDCVQLAMRCDLGIFSLGKQTTQGNIPGKFITYIMSGLPVFGLCSDEAEIASVIKSNKLGRLYDGSCGKTAAKIISTEKRQNYDAKLIEKYYQNNHSTQSAAQKLTE